MLKLEFRSGMDNSVDYDLESILDKFLKREQGFYDLPLNVGLVEDIDSFRQESEGKYDHIVVLGIGGSALGIKAIRDVMMQKEDRDKLRVIDNVDPDFIDENIRDLDLGRTMFVVITKSGGTSETMSLYFAMREMIEKAGLEHNEHFVFITDPEKGLLRELVGVTGVKSFEVPPNVGGRWSVLSAVGLVPAALAGIDIKSILEGAKQMRDSFLDTKQMGNMPFLMAKYQIGNYSAGRAINVVIPYSNRLFRFGEWYAQLLAESTGKIGKDGNGVGLTPVTALGATDQHSQLQLYAQGPDDKQFQFISVRDFENDLNIPLMESDAVKEKFGFLDGVTFGRLLNVELLGTMDSLIEVDRPVMEIALDRVDEVNLGRLFMLFEGATALLGEMLEIDAFNQPGVERSKILTKEYLTKENA